jgi:hypothetical protein
MACVDMINHKTFSKRQLINLVGERAIMHLEEMRLEVERFIEEEIGEENVLSFSETSDAYASTVTVWYRASKAGKYGAK